MAKVTDNAQGELARPVRKLTVKQERFAQAYIETSNASEAYRRAYDAENSSDAVVWTSACNLLKNHKVAIRVQELQAKHAENHDVTVEYLTAEYREAISLAKITAQPAALVGAVTALGKLHGLVVERKHIDADQRHHYTAEPVSSLDAFMEDIAALGAEEPPQKLISQ